MKNFVEKYKPKSSSEIPQAIASLKEAIKNKEHCLIFGPSGTGKTTSVHLIAEELDYEVVEVNASDFRTKEQIETIIGSASKQQSLFQKEKILIIDEVDCLSGTEDRGGAQAIVSILNESKYSIVLTVNDINNEKIKEIKKEVNIIEFKPIKSREITPILKNICEKEKIKYTQSVLEKIAINAQGDIKAAINDLQSNIVDNEVELPLEEREVQRDIHHILNSIFKQKNNQAQRLMENTSIDLDEYMLWLDENLPKEYSQEDVFDAYELISKADIFKGRIQHWQYWRFLVYRSFLITTGISIKKLTINKNISEYKRSMRPLRIWQLNMKNSKMKTIAKKIGKQTHISTKEVIKTFNSYKRIIKDKRTHEELKLEPEEIEWIKNL